MRQVKGKKQGIFQEEGIEYATVKWTLSSRSQQKKMAMESKARRRKGWPEQRREQLCLFQASQMPAHYNNSSQSLARLFANWPHHSQNYFHKASNTSFTLLNIDNCANGGKAMVDKTV